LGILEHVILPDTLSYSAIDIKKGALPVPFASFELIFPDGRKYVGEFKDGKRDGQGTVTYPAPHSSAGYKYIGQFKDGLQSGHGTVTYSAPHSFAGYQYVGQFNDDEKSGLGTATYPNGDMYVGEFKDDMKHGQGFMFSADYQVDFCTYKKGQDSNCSGSNAYDAAVSLKKKI